jgi:UDP-N-acetylglucosamine 1-carboxyvinyltransferase
LKLIPLSILLDGDFEINNVPHISDVLMQLKILTSIGGTQTFSESKLTLNSDAVKSSKMDEGLSKTLRASIVFAGPLLSRFGQATIACPGGCTIGARSIETHLDAFRQAGVTTEERGGTFLLSAPRGLSDVEISMKEKSVTATENIILYLCRGSLKAHISNVAIEPEVMHLI